MCSGKGEVILLDSFFSLLDLTRTDIVLNEEEKAGDGISVIRNSGLFREDCSGSLCGYTSSPLHPTLLPPNTHTHSTTIFHSLL